jgi:hypothetical protein
MAVCCAIAILGFALCIFDRTGFHPQNKRASLRKLSPHYMSHKLPSALLPQLQFDVSGWKNYSDQFFTFKYPPDWRAATGIGIEPGFFTIDLYDGKNYYSEGGSVVSPIQINYKPDTYGSSIDRLFTNPIVQQTVQKQHIRIGYRMLMS